MKMIKSFRTVHFTFRAEQKVRNLVLNKIEVALERPIMMVSDSVEDAIRSELLDESS